MKPDSHLIAEAEKLAGSAVHEIAHQIHLYVNACDLLHTTRAGVERVNLIAAVVRSERFLRTFIHQRRQAAQAFERR